MNLLFVFFFFFHFLLFSFVACFFVFLCVSTFSLFCSVLYSFTCNLESSHIVPLLLLFHSSLFSSLQFIIIYNFFSEDPLTNQTLLNTHMLTLSTSYCDIVESKYTHISVLLKQHKYILHTYMDKRIYKYSYLHINTNIYTRTDVHKCKYACINFYPYRNVYMLVRKET